MGVFRAWARAIGLYLVMSPKAPVKIASSCSMDLSPLSLSYAPTECNCTLPVPSGSVCGVSRFELVAGRALAGGEKAVVDAELDPFNAFVCGVGLDEVGCCGEVCLHPCLPRERMRPLGHTDLGARARDRHT